VHTLYELDRLAGRYDGLADERGMPRTVFALGGSKPFDLFDLVRQFGQLSALVDAQYGSATFVSARGFAAYDILVSTSGLLARPVGGTHASPVRPAGTATGR
jgi:alkylation response protein AidB-like acyl-CoA dehydrogenase